MSRLGRAALGLGLFCACNSPARPGGSPANAPASAELRDAKGDLLLSVRPAQKGHIWFDAAAGRDEPIAEEGGALDTHDGKGVAFRLLGARRVPGEPLGDERLDLARAGAPFARLERREGGWRLGDPRGTPLGRIATTSGVAVAYDPGGIPIARAEEVGGRIVVTDRDGKPLGYVSNRVGPERAVLLFLPTVAGSGALRALLLAQRARCCF